MDYKEVIKDRDFISLDISVRSSGWVKNHKGILTYGTKALESQTELGRRVEFREFIEELFGKEYIETVYIEDVIAGTNFKTTKGLIQLNTIVDDLRELKVLDIGRIERIDNRKWKKYLKQLSDYKAIEKKNDKKIIIECMNNLGFNENEKQDIYDALGMALGCIYKEFQGD